jgi:hypothetical protein
MKRKPKLTKRERQEKEAAESRTRLIKIVERIANTTANRIAAALPSSTTFEQAVSTLLTMYEPSTGEPPLPTDEILDAALVMLEIMQRGKGLSVNEAIESLVGICADTARSEAVKAELDTSLSHRLRLLFNHQPTNPTILARSADFDASMDRLASEIP